MDYLLGFLTLAGIGALIYISYKKEVPTFDKEIIQEKDNKIGELTQKLNAEQSRKDELAGKNKQLFVQLTKMESSNTELSKRVAKYEAEEVKSSRELEQKIGKLDVSQKALEDERIRIRREDEARTEAELAERDRMWAEHEEKVLKYMTEVCAMAEFGFETYTNNNLPESFDGRLKPDFMVGFLDQFVIFDAKISRSDNLQNYITTQVKNTATKIKGNSKIYSSVFFVVPTDAIGELKKLYYYEDGYSFFIISMEAIMPVLASLKKIQNYEFAEKMDPQERENIINMIAEFDQHINLRNAMNLVITQHGINVLEKTEKLPQDLQDDIKLKKSKMRIIKVNETDLKPLMISTERQQKQIDKVVKPKPKVEEPDMESAKSLFN